MKTKQCVLHCFKPNLIPLLGFYVRWIFDELNSIEKEIGLLIDGLSDSKNVIYVQFFVALTVFTPALARLIIFCDHICRNYITGGRQLN